MTTAVLVVGAIAMGVAALPHCALMCAAPCAAVAGGLRANTLGFQGGRLLGYMAGGGVASASMGVLATWTQSAPVLRPFWVMLQLALLGLGVWWLVAGRPPAWPQRRGPPATTRIVVTRRVPWRAAGKGALWVAWPCATLQGALLLAAMAGSAVEGALVMGAFALASAPALVVGPWAWTKLKALPAVGGAASDRSVIGYRLAGLCLALASGWAASHGAFERLVAWCAS